MRIDELPSMLVERVEAAKPMTVYGRFDRLDGVRENGGYFRIARGDYIWANLTVLDASACTVTFTDERDPDVARLVAGQRYTWLDDYWKTQIVEAIADERTQWRQVRFAPRDAAYFEQNGVTGWRPAGDPLPEGAVDTKVVAGGWDHEHCDHCGDHIDGENPLYYEDGDRNFLCTRCYERYAAKHDVSFQVGG